MVKVNINKLIDIINFSSVEESISDPRIEIAIKKINDALHWFEFDEVKNSNCEKEIESLLALQVEANQMAERIQNPLDQIKKIIETDSCLDVKCKAIDEVLLSRRHQLRQLIKGQAEALISLVSQEGQ